MIRCRRLLFMGLFLLFGTLSANTWAGALKAYQVIDTGAFTCDGLVRTQNWTNTTGSPVFIKRAELLMLMNFNSIPDYGGKVLRLSDNSIIVFGGWDHYANPTTLHLKSVKFSPNYFLVNVADTLQLQYWCTSGTPQGHEAVTIWYTQAAP